MPEQAPRRCSRRRCASGSSAPRCAGTMRPSGSSSPLVPLLIEDLGEHSVDARIHGHARVAGLDLDMLGGGIQTRLPGDDAVAPRVDRHGANAGWERSPQVLAKRGAALTIAALA